MMQKPIRVLCVFSTLDRGGAETMCMNLYRHIDRSKVQFDFVKHTSSKGAFEDEIRSLGGRVYEAPRYKFYNHVKYIEWWKNHFKTHREHMIVHGHFYTISAIYFRVAKRFGRKTVAHSHCVSSGKRTLKGVISDLIISRIDKYADERFACSYLAGEWIFRKHQFTVLNNAIESNLFRYDPKVREEVRKELGIDDKCLVVGTVGRIMRQKNPEGIISIFQETLEKNDRARLLWVGDGPDRAAAEEMLAARHLSDKVMMVGVRSDVNRLLQAMDVFILPSIFEGLGVAAIEAQAAGLPCYVSDKVPEEVKITDLCEFIPLDRWDIWSDAICKDHGERRDMQSEIKAAGYDVQETAEWLCKFYQTLAEKG